MGSVSPRSDEVLQQARGARGELQCSELYTGEGELRGFQHDMPITGNKDAPSRHSTSEIGKNNSRHAPGRTLPEVSGPGAVRSPIRDRPRPNEIDSPLSGNPSRPGAPSSVFSISSSELVSIPTCCGHRVRRDRRPTCRHARRLVEFTTCACTVHHRRGDRPWLGPPVELNRSAWALYRSYGRRDTAARPKEVVGWHAVLGPRHAQPSKQ